METKKQGVTPEKHKEFFEEIAKVFQKYTGINHEYSISPRRLLNKLLEQKNDKQIFFRTLYSHSTSHR